MKDKKSLHKSLAETWIDSISYQPTTKSSPQKAKLKIKKIKKNYDHETNNTNNSTN